MIWTDVAQTVMMLLGLIASIVFGMYQLFHCLKYLLKSVQASSMLAESQKRLKRCLTEIDFNSRCT